MKILKYIGGDVSVLELTLNKEYRVIQIDDLEGLWIEDDFWLKKRFNKNFDCEEIGCFVTEEESQRCFEVIE